MFSALFVTISFSFDIKLTFVHARKFVKYLFPLNRVYLLSILFMKSQQLQLIFIYIAIINNITFFIMYRKLLCYKFRIFYIKFIWVNLLLFRLLLLLLRTK